MAEVICPVCGLANPADALTCFNCLSPLGGAIQPGEAPTKKGTGELEPILPEWLRSVREKSRQSTGSQIEEPEENTQPVSDLLAGLEAQSKSDEEEEVPDWLTRITGATGRKKDEPGKVGDRRVEMGKPEPGNLEETQPTKPVQKTPVPALQDETPPWVKALDETDKDDGTDRLDEWFKQAAAESGSEAPPSAELAEDEGMRGSLTPPAEGESLELTGSFEDESVQPVPPALEADLLDWLKSLDSVTPEAPASDLPDWLIGLNAPPPEKITPPEELEPVDLEPVTGMGSEPLEAELPDWLKENQVEPVPASAIRETDLADWLKDLKEPSSGEEAQEGVFRAFEPDQPAEAGFEATPAETPLPENFPTPQVGESEALEAELPDWLKALEPGPETAPSLSGDSAHPPISSDDFSRSPEEESAAPEWAEVPSEPIQAESISATLEVELPDWLDQLGKDQAPTSQAELPEWLTEVMDPEPGGSTAAVERQDAISEPEPPERSEALPAGEPPEEKEEEPVLEPEPLPEGELSSLFTGVPDWLEEPAPADASMEEPSALPAAEEARAIAPVELPAWVQAMRPVEAALGPIPAGEAEEEIPETSGPLAGLRGVLPSFVYPGPSSKPKSQAIKMQAGEEQLKHAALLEQILQAETNPEPMAAPAALAPLRGLRMGIGLALLLVLLAAILAGTSFLPLPSGRPAETIAALEAVEAVPANAAALVVFDYEPSLAGEMEAAAAPLLDHLIVLKAPRLTLISTSPTGSALAERMMRNLGGQGYTNLGYLAGGLGGVRSFAQDPASAMPLQADSTPWYAPAAEGIRHMADYRVIIVITDSADSGRTWIEQAAHLSGPDRFVVVASAQAGPMLQPYFQSGQIRGLVTGLFDSAVLEQNNAGRPGLARRYWDAYNLGVILALVLLAFGSAWNLVQGLRERAAAQEAE